jgi:hypothetical protein
LLPAELALLVECFLVEAVGRGGFGDDGVELFGGLVLAFEVREDATAGEVCAQDDGGVGGGRGEEDGLAEVAEGGDEALLL